MPIEIHSATPSDAPALTEVFLAAFSDEFNVTLFPRTPDVHEWWINRFTEEITSSTASPPHTILLKAVDTSQHSGDGEGAIAGFANWKLPERDNRDNDESVEWPESSDAKLCERFFGLMHAKREKYTAGKPHYYLDMLGTHPDYQKQGIASKFLQWGISRADQEGLDVFLSASPEGRPLYERAGFRLLESEEICPGYVQSYLIRSPT